MRESPAPDKRKNTGLKTRHYRLLLLGGDTGAFFEGVDGVHGEIFKAFEEAAGPADLDRVNFGGSAEAEVDAEVAAGDEARAAADFIHKNARAGFDCDFCADGVAGGSKGG